FFYFYNMIKAAMAVKSKFEQLTYKTVQLRNKLEEIRIVNRAKMLLISHKGMSEEEAHRHIEQTAMNRCQKRIQVAREIVSELGTGPD
ncbi:MAG: ANTAR domain-containing protein, partial [Treponema sp.]|nr:ANTAR domain-containing protein [Treponema sp.]